jgi:Uma2 family endonuclease
MKARSPSGTARYPDVTVECGQTDMDGLVSEPVVLFEALSRSNTLRQQLRLLDDYQAIPTVQQIVFVERERPAALSWLRTPDGWRRDEFDGLDAVIELPALAISLPLAEVYERFPFASEAQAG